MNKIQYELKITHLYPEEMNLYGDIGNIIAMKNRAEIRGIKVKIQNISAENSLKSGQSDIYFFGGGQDKDQLSITNDLIKNKKDALLKDLKNGAAMLAICGGYQLLGKYFLTGDGGRAEGIGYLPIETVAPTSEVKQRCIGNISTHVVHERTMEQLEKYYASKVNNVNVELLYTLVGFENHSGRTRILHDEPIHLSKIITGIGDNEKKGFDGVRYNNVFGSYMHGSFLPRNPQMTDLLLSIALERKYKGEFDRLEPIDDKLEWRAHRQALRLE